MRRSAFVAACMHHHSDPLARLLADGFTPSAGLRIVIGS
jgi:hypothetical protein